MQSTTVGQRVRKLLYDGWRGKQRRMAAELGVSRSVVSRTVNDQRPPSFQLIAAIAEKMPGLDLRWLLTGVGRAFGEETESVAEDPRLPVTRTALLRLPAEHAARTIPVARSLYRPTRYVCELGRDDPAVRASNVHLLPGDEIILETDPAFWGEDLQRIRDRLCVVRLRTAEGVNGLFGRARCLIGQAGRPIAWSVDVFGVGEMPLVFSGAESVTQESKADVRDPGTGKRYRTIELEDKQPRASCELAAEISPGGESTEPPESSESRTMKDDIVAKLYAVGICLIRELGRTETT